jgi:YceI-like domain
MKTPSIQNRKTPTFVLAATLACSLTFQAAAEAVRYEAQPSGSKCKMEGTSNMPMHDKWSMESIMVTGFMEVDPNFPEAALTNPLAAKPVTQVSIPVRSYKSGSSTMDSKMQGHMQITKFPKIEYRLLELKPTSPAGSTGVLKFDAVGTLTIVGKTVTNTMPVTIEKKDGKLRVIGSASVKMSSHGLEPYKFLLVSTGDELKITYDWALAPKAK